MTEQIPEDAKEPIQPEVVSEIKTRKTPLKTVLLVVLGLVLVAGAVYIGVTIGKKQSPPKVIPQVIEISPTPDETANWKTYKSEKYGYSIKYPEVAKIYYEGFYDNKLLETSISYDDNIGYPGYSVTISVMSNDARKTALQLAQEELTKSKKNLKEHPDSFIGDISKCKIEPVKVGKVDGVRFAACVCGPECGIQAIIEEWFIKEWFIKDGKIIQVYANLGRENQKTIFNQILSTFIFVDQDVVDETVNWKTYTSESGYQFKYPSDWNESTGINRVTEISSPNKLIVMSIYHSTDANQSSLSDLKIVEAKENKILKDIIIDSKQGFEFESLSPPQAGAILAGDNNTVPGSIIKAFMTYQENDKVDALTVFDQILFTFKFLD